MITKYEDATDIKTKHDYAHVSLDQVLHDKRYNAETYEEFAEWIKTEIMAWFNAEFYFKHYQVTHIFFDYSGIRINFDRSETEKEYYGRKKQEELEYAQHLSCVEKEKHLAKEKIRKKYQQYEELRKYFENQNIEELLKD